MPYRASELRPPAAPRRSPARWLTVAAILAAVAGTFVGLGRRRTPQRRPPAARPLAEGCVAVQVMATRDDGSRDVLCGPVREIMSRRGEPMVAAESFAVPVVTAAPVARGWVFVTADGTVTRSDTFTGPLHLLGHVPCLDVATATARSVGRAAVLDRDGALWTTDGAALTRRTFPARVRSAVFADATHGAVVLDRGELLETRDGGRTWPSVDLQREVAWAVVVTSGGIVVATTAGTQRLEPGGPRREGVSLDDEQVREATGVPTTPDDRAVRASVRAREVFRVAASADRCAPAGAEVSTAEFEAPFETGGTPSYRCHIANRRGDVEDVGSTALRPSSVVPPGSETESAILTGSGLVDASLWQSADGRVRLHLAWSGRDAVGRFIGRAGPETEGLPMRPPATEEPWNGSTVMVEAISRRGLLLSSEDLGPQLLWAGSGGRVLALGRPIAERLGAAIPQRTFAALSDGAVAMVQWAYGSSGALVAALEIAPDGAVRQHRGLVADPSNLVGLGRWGGAFGVVLWRPGGAASEWFHPFDGAAPRALPRPPPGHPRACATAAPVGDPDAITVWSRRLDLDFEAATREDGLMESPGFGMATRYELEWARGQMCVRAVTLNRGGMGVEGLGGVTMTLQARPGDRFEGSLSDAGATRVACHARR